MDDKVRKLIDEIDNQTRRIDAARRDQELFVIGILAGSIFGLIISAIFGWI